MILGTCVKFTVATDTTPDAITITITDRGGVEQITDAALTGSTTSWTYNYQSATTDTAGRYYATVTATSGVYTAKSKIKFFLD